MPHNLDVVETLRERLNGRVHINISAPPSYRMIVRTILREMDNDIANISSAYDCTRD